MRGGAGAGQNYYQALLSNYNPGLTLSPAAKQIELDLLRTLPNNVHYENSHAKGIPKLRRVLLAFSLHNPEVEYCQVGITKLRPSRSAISYITRASTGSLPLHCCFWTKRTPSGAWSTLLRCSCLPATSASRCWGHRWTNQVPVETLKFFLTVFGQC